MLTQFVILSMRDMMFVRNALKDNAAAMAILNELDAITPEKWEADPKLLAARWRVVQADKQHSNQIKFEIGKYLTHTMNRLCGNFNRY